MYQKKCPECGAYSYSAYEGTLWQCPECQTDISDVETEVAGSGEDTINELTRREAMKCHIVSLAGKKSI